MNNKVALIILDGWGLGKKDESDAIFNASTPFMDSLLTSSPNATLLTDGENVGLPNGQMGNSEVGHLNIGAGRVIYQDLVKINIAIRDGILVDNPVLVDALETVKSRGSKLHFMGLVSNGGVHSHIDHLVALCHIARKHGVEQSYIHAFSDGRDTDPRSGMKFIADLETQIEGTGAVVSTVIGRYFAMDRDKRWERVKKAYDLLVNGIGEDFDSTFRLFDSSYTANVTDEFIPPALIKGGKKIEPNDVVICFNFRTDRCREITQVLTQKDMPELDMRPLPLHYVTMTSYDKTFKDVKVIFGKDNLALTLGETLANAGKTQVRIAETEKYPHVTFFFSGGREAEFDNERRLLVDSPKVATYDLQPEMSARHIASTICADMEAHGPDFICLNFANPDMVGHTGVYDAIVKAVETTDQCCEQVTTAARKLGYSVIIIADHGNADVAINPDGSPNTAHSTNPVPVVLLSDDVTQIHDGILADVAPTVLKLMGVEKPEEMSGQPLF
ncbi:MAG: 2,3-bisphosphoglycerate-independent phosphoglycerate mutase [Bacteroidota bacterium]